LVSSAKLLEDALRTEKNVEDQILDPRKNSVSSVCSLTIQEMFSNLLEEKSYCSVTCYNKQMIVIQAMIKDGINIVKNRFG